jgi:hypothetical protein
LARVVAQGKLPLPARPGDRQWEQRLEWVLDETEKEGLLQVLVLKQQALCTTLLKCQSEETAGKLIKEIAGLVTLHYDALLPYMSNSREDRAAALSDQWKMAFGDPDDPEVKRRIQQTADMLNKRREDAVAGRKKGGRRQ